MNVKVRIRASRLVIFAFAFPFTSAPGPVVQLYRSSNSLTDQIHSFVVCCCVSASTNIVLLWLACVRIGTFTNESAFMEVIQLNMAIVSESFSHFCVFCVEGNGVAIKIITLK